jgi:hypothetical protein
MTLTLTPSPPAPTTAAQPTRRTRRRWPAVATLTMGVVLVRVALLWRMQWSRPSSSSQRTSPRTRSLVVVRETIAYEEEGLASAAQVHQYVMDRRTNANVDDTRAWAFEDTTLLDRSWALLGGDRFALHDLATLNTRVEVLVPGRPTATQSNDIA